MAGSLFGLLERCPTMGMRLSLASLRCPDLKQAVTSFPRGLLRGCSRSVRLLSRPTRATLLKKGGDAFLCVDGERVHAHYFLRIRIGFWLVQIDLSIECLFAQCDCQRACLNNAQGEFTALFYQIDGGYDQINQSPFGGRRGVNHLAREQHLQSPLASHGPAQCDHGCSTEQPDFHTRSRKGRTIGGDR